MTTTEIPATFLSVPDGPAGAGDVPGPPAGPIPADQPIPGVPGGPDADPAAPYGRLADGTPRKKPGRKPRSGIGRPRAADPGRGGGTSTPRTGTSSGSRTGGGSKKKQDGPDYRAAVLSALQLPGAALALAGARRPELLADAIALDTYGPGIADALADLAREQPAVARVLERFMQAGPYGALIAAAAPLVLQILTNHGVLRPGIAGSADPGEMVAKAMGQAAA